MIDQLCLVSTSGDMSSRGMGTKNTIYLFPNEYKKQVDNFLKAQLNFHLHTYNENWLKGNYKKTSKIPYKRYSESYHVLKDLNVFTCKYDFRTSWDLSLFDEGELQQYEPYRVEDNFNILKNKEKRRGKYRSSLVKKIIEETSIGEPITKIVKKNGITWNTWNSWCKKDPTLDELFQKAKERKSVV